MGCKKTVLTSCFFVVSLGFISQLQAQTIQTNNGLSYQNSYQNISYNNTYSSNRYSSNQYPGNTYHQGQITVHSFNSPRGYNNTRTNSRRYNTGSGLNRSGLNTRNSHRYNSGLGSQLSSQLNNNAKKQKSQNKKQKNKTNHLSRKTLNKLSNNNKIPKNNNIKNYYGYNGFAPAYNPKTNQK